jgi:ABC-type lipoprotein release transport system permease subunit
MQPTRDIEIYLAHLPLELRDIVFELRSIIASQLYGVGPLDPSVLGAVTVVLAIASVIACLAPARRATQVDPVIALTQP